MRLAPWPALSALALLPLAACLQVTTDTGSGTSGSPGAGGPSGGDDGGSGGTGCATDPETQVVLCAQSNACPGVTVDPGAFPGCGFRVNGGEPLDLECLCSESLCPIGVPTTCAQAMTMLQAQSAIVVCQQVSEGRCVQLVTPDAGAVPASCDRGCQAACGAAADCVQICGC